MEVIERRRRSTGINSTLVRCSMDILCIDSRFYS